LTLASELHVHHFVGISRRTKRLLLWSLAGIVLAVTIPLTIWLASSGPSRILKQKALEALRNKFRAEVELADFNVDAFPRPRLEGNGLVLRYAGRRDLPPLIRIRHFEAAGGLVPLWGGHVQTVRLEGLEIQAPPKSDRPKLARATSGENPRDLTVDEIIADGTTLTILPRRADKDPLVWDIKRLRLHSVGRDSPMDFKATLVNARPPGDIETSGKFGPWAGDEPGDTPVSGTYQFRHADLSDFKGIAGILSSDGSYNGALNRLDVKGTTDTPDFTLDVSGNPVHLTTEFQAVVDGTNGDTLLQPVVGHFGNTQVTARGGVEKKQGEKGKTIDLDTTVDQGRLEDLLRLGVKGPTPSMTGAIRFRAKLIIPPGEVDVAKKMRLNGRFEIIRAHFSDFDIQAKVNKLSHAGQGEPKAPVTDTVASNFAGVFRLGGGEMTFRELSFDVPGVGVTLDGTYNLADQSMDFHGKARLDAKLSQTQTGIKSFFLKALDPLFAKKDAGAVVPIRIHGTRDKPAFGLDMKF
jgi:hypothetical protein